MSGFLNRFYNLLTLAGILWSVFTLWSFADSWVEYPGDRWVSALIVLLPWIGFAVFNYLIYGRLSLLLRHPASTDD